MKVYGIESCGTVKKARAWLETKGRGYEFVDFRKTRPSGAQVTVWVSTFGAKAMRNTSGGAYRALGSEKDDWTEAEWTEAFTRDPMLIKRPIIEKDGRPIQVGFKDAKALE